MVKPILADSRYSLSCLVCIYFADMCDLIFIEALNLVLLELQRNVNVSWYGAGFYDKHISKLSVNYVFVFF